MSIEPYFKETLIQTKKIKNLFTNSDIRNTEGNKVYLSLVKDLGVIKYDERGKSGNKTSDSPEKYKLVNIGDLVINPMNVTIGSVGVSKYTGCLSGVYIILKPKKDVNSNYYHYVFHDKGFQKYLRTISYGIMEIRESLNKTEFFQLKVPNPSIKEQSQIVSYLDKKTKQIDQLIKKIVKTIELLKEQKISLFNEVVTKGLNPNVEMKNSGVEWIGEIPSHWKLKKLKYISEITYGISPNESSYNNIGKGTVLVNGPVEYSISDFGYTRSLKWTTEPKKFSKKGSLLFCLRGSTTGRLNISHEDLSIGRGVCSIQSNEDQNFLIYSMFCIRRWIQGFIQGSTFPSVTKVDVDNFKICSLPTNEQQQIVKYLDEQKKVIDDSISKRRKKIELLKDYKQSLISEVVIGKKKVKEDMI